MQSRWVKKCHQGLPYLLCPLRVLVTHLDGKPFFGLITGYSGSGKTFFLLQLLEREFKNYFSHIYLICPTVYHNKSYLEWKYFKDPKFYPIDCKSQNFEEFLAIARSESKDTNTLLIIDDCAASREIKKQSSELTELAFGGRHEQLSVIILTRQITSVSKAVREQLSWIVCFSLVDEDDSKMLANKYLARLSEEKKEVLQFLDREKYAFFLAQVRYPKRKFIRSKKTPITEVKSKNHFFSTRTVKKRFHSQPLSIRGWK